MNKLLSKIGSGRTPVLHNYGHLPLTSNGYWLVLYALSHSLMKSMSGKNVSVQSLHRVILRLLVFATDLVCLL